MSFFGQARAEACGKYNRGDRGIAEKKMETTDMYRGYIGIVEKKMETSDICRGDIGVSSG